MCKSAAVVWSVNNTGFNTSSQSVYWVPSDPIPLLSFPEFLVAHIGSIWGQRLVWLGVSGIDDESILNADLPQHGRYHIHFMRSVSAPTQIPIGSLLCLHDRCVNQVTLTTKNINVSRSLVGYHLEPGEHTYTFPAVPPFLNQASCLISIIRYVSLSLTHSLLQQAGWARRWQEWSCSICRH